MNASIPKFRASDHQPPDPNFGFADPDLLLIHHLAAKPFSSTANTAAAINRSPRTARRYLETLVDQGKAHCCTMGSSSLIPRFFLAPQTLRESRIPAHYYNSLAGMKRLATGISATECIYTMAIEMDLIRPDCHFQWHSQRAYDATAGKPDRWAALFWCGIWADAAAIRHRINSLAPDWRGRWPTVLAFAVPDLWQAHVLQQVLDELRFTPNSAIWVAGTGSWALPPSQTGAQYARGWPREAILHPAPASPSGRDLVKFLEDERITTPDGATIQKLLQILEQWPGLLVSHIQALLPSQTNRSRMADVLLQMERLELAVERDRAYYPWVAAAVRAADRDRVSKGRTAGRMVSSDPDGGRRRLRTHDQTVANIAAHFQKLGCPIAPGWRAVDDAGSCGKIDPDAVIYLNTSPYQEGWHYVEYERRAVRDESILHKLRSYRMQRRSNDWPVIFVVPNEEVERSYHEHGSDINLITGVSSKQRPPDQWHCFSARVYLE